MYPISAIITVLQTGVDIDFVGCKQVFFVNVQWFVFAEGVAGTPWFFVNDIDLGVNPNDQVDYNTWIALINILLRSRE